MTFESLAGLYIDGLIVDASINTDEAGQFFGGHTMKADTARNALGGFTKLFDDGSLHSAHVASQTSMAVVELMTCA